MLSIPIHGYRLLISPWIGPRCRFLPTCSDYALDALARHGAIRGGWLTVRRLARCQPFGGSGFDPVPDVQVAPMPCRPGMGPRVRQHRRPELMF
ncbi:MAG: membrane protein insertion efficiency factor YidD [Geminicoccaceae bacterium]